MRKIHKVDIFDKKIYCGIWYRKKADKPYSHDIFNHDIETSQSGAQVDCLKCLKSIQSITNKKMKPKINN